MASRPEIRLIDARLQFTIPRPSMICFLNLTLNLYGRVQMRLLDFTSGIGAKTKHVPRDLPAMRLGSVTTSTRASLLVRVFVPFWHVIYWPLRPFLNPPLASENDACCFMVLRKHTPTILGCSTSVFISRNQPKDSGVSNLWDTGATFPPYATSTTKAPSFKHRTSSPVFCQQCPYF